MSARAGIARTTSVPVALLAIAAPLISLGMAFPASASAVPPSSVVTWGQNDDGQLGDGTLNARLSPGPVTGLDDVVDIHGGREHVAALDSRGQVWTWGSNAQGQLGTGGTADSSVPVVVPGMTDATAVETGHNYTVALTSEGTVVSAGLNSDGQLGDGTTTTRRTPVQVQGLSGAVAIAAGRNMTYAIRADGTVAGWGRNAEGQLGDGSLIGRRGPVRVGDLEGVVRIAGGRDHGLAVLGDGSVWAWGQNGYGQVGDGTVANRTAPVRVVSSGVVDVAAGAHHSFALRADGTVLSWGRNYRFALGDGTSTQRSRPVQVTGVSDAVSIGAGRDTGVVTTSAGRVRVWGHNENGQLGDGTTVNRATAVELAGVEGATKAAGGGALYQVVLVGQPVVPVPNEPPTARIAEPICDGLTCDFSGLGSTDPDGDIAAWDWTFATTPPTSSGLASPAGVAFPAPGAYDVSLVVTDDDGATARADVVVTVQDDPGTATRPTLVGSTTANANATGVSVATPTGVAAGDQLVLVATTNGTSAVDPGAGWTRVATAADGSEVTSSVWQRAAPVEPVPVRVTLSRIAKVGVVLTAYRGAGSVDAAVAGVTGSTATTTHVSPAVAVPRSGSLVLRYWSDKASLDRTWSAPADSRVLAASYGVGGGSVAVLTSDEAPESSSVPARSARSTVATAKAVSWAVVVPPA